MLTFRALAAGAISEASAYAAYLTEQTSPVEQADLGLAAYYGAGGSAADAQAAGMGSVPLVRADMDPVLARTLDLTPGAALTEAELGNILSGRRADGKDLPGNQRHVLRYKSKQGEDRFRTSGMDLCLSAPKSVSVAWAFAETVAERASIVQAHRDARDETLRYIESQVARGRLGKGGASSEPARLGWISIDHYTARPTIAVTRPDPVTGVIGTEIHTVGKMLAGDPQLHSHNIMPNVMVTDSGKVVSVNSKLIAGRIKEFGAVYQALLATRLREAGIDVVLDEKTHAARLSAVPEAVCEEFSKRGRDAEGFAKKLASARGYDWDTLSTDLKVSFLKGGAKVSRRSKRDDLANLTVWQDQAAAMGWQHRTVVSPDGPTAMPADDVRLKAAYETAMPLLDEALQRRAVIGASDIRTQAARGLIGAGISTAADVGLVTRQMAHEGVMQDGRRTRLIWGEAEDGQVKMTTVLHRDQETRLTDLARAAAADRSRGLSARELSEAIERTGIEFRGAHGKTQADAMARIGCSGRMAVLIGVAGAGKTTLLTPLVDAWHARGDEVWGMSLARRQGDALKDAGIAASRALAIEPFLDRLAADEVTVGRNSVVVIDELGQIGTRQMLDLLEQQQKHGFQIVAVGDDQQCQSISAGPVIELLREALGKEAIPEILTTVRQSTEREREITGLFRAGSETDVRHALDMKRSDATPSAEMVPGDYRQAVERIAALAMERRAAAPNTGYAVTISAPTNAEALAIGREVRKLRQQAGEVGADRVTRRATDGRGAHYDLTLSEGDKVRLHQRTNAVFTEGSRKQAAPIGNNGTVLAVVALRDDGLVLAGEHGKQGFVSWNTLSDGAGRIKLGLGECLTIDSAQGITSDEHIFAMPSGSHSVTNYKAYVAASRHRVTSWIVCSAGAELREVMGRRPLGAAGAVTDDDVWANAARNLSRQPLKQSATTFLRTMVTHRMGTTRDFHRQASRQQARAANGQAAATMLAKVGRKRAILDAIGKTVERVSETFDKLTGKVRTAPPASDAPTVKPPVDAQLVDTPKDIGKSTGPGAAPPASDEPAQGAPITLVEQKEATALKSDGGQSEQIENRHTPIAQPLAAENRDETGREQAPKAAALRAPHVDSKAIVRVSESEAVAQFREALRDAGMDLKGRDPRMDGRWHNVSLQGQKGGKRSGSYIGWLDGRAAGAMTNHQTGMRTRWKAEGGAIPMKAAEIAARTTTRAAERRAREDAGAATAKALIAGARPADDGYPYLQRKGVAAHGLYVGVQGQTVTVRSEGGGEKQHSIAGRLLIPLRDASGDVRNLQTVSPDGKTKLLLSGAQKAGVFHVIGELRTDAPIVMGGGYATAATLGRALGMTAVMAVDSNNLMPVAQALRAMHPDSKIAIGGDNDHHLPRRPVPLANVGLEKAAAAAVAIGARLMVPQFEASDRSTDWNDVQASQGLRGVRAALLNALKATETPTVQAVSVAKSGSFASL